MKFHEVNSKFHPFAGDSSTKPAWMIVPGGASHVLCRTPRRIEVLFEGGRVHACRSGNPKGRTTPTTATSASIPTQAKLGCQKLN